jgi:hypothetical protein
MKRQEVVPEQNLLRRVQNVVINEVSRGYIYHKPSN